MLNLESAALDAWTRTEYDDAARRVVVRSDIETKGLGSDMQFWNGIKGQ